MGDARLNIEQFIRESAARGLSRRATRLALGWSFNRFRDYLATLGTIEWPAVGCSIDNQRANEDRRGHCTPAVAEALACNRQKRTENCRRTAFGKRGTIEELTKQFGSTASARTVMRRVREGMPLEQALTLPPKRTPPSNRATLQP